MAWVCAGISIHLLSSLTPQRLLARSIMLPTLAPLLSPSHSNI